VVNSNQVFRADALHKVDDVGRALLRDLGISRIVDLRRTDELDEMPSAVDRETIEIVHTPILSDAASSHQLMLGENLDLAGIYDMMIDTRGANLARALTQVATAPGPVVFHCTAGKDRTGVLAALILEVVGADRQAIVADYSATAVNLAGDWAETMLASHDVPSLAAAGVDIVTIITQSPAPLMEALLERLDREYGGAEEYLKLHGLRSDDLTALRTKLTG